MKRTGLSIYLILILSLTGCGSETSVGGSPNGGNTAVTASAPTLTPGVGATVGGNGPTGTVDPIDPSLLGNLTTPPTIEFFDTPDPVEPTPDFGTPVTVCGTVYKRLNATEAEFVSDSGLNFSARDISQEARVLILNLRFPNDSVSVCAEGFEQIVNNTRILNINTITSQGAATNPSRDALRNQFNFEVCGTYRGTTNTVNDSEITDLLSRPHLLNNSSNLRVPTLPGTGVIWACAYSNRNFYNNFAVAFQRFFDAEAIDFGVYQ